MLRVCVIGAGPIGNLHADIYQSDELAQLCAICDIQPERAERAGKRLGIPHYLSVEEMLEQHRPDVCSVATGGYEYASDHYLPTLQALRTGSHVLCEKPISNEIAHAEEMVRVAEALNLCLAVDFNHRFTPTARLAKQWLDEGKLGELLFANVALWIGRPEQQDSPNYHLKALNPHSVDIMRHFCGDVEAVQCFAMRAKGRNFWSTASFNFQMSNGMVAHITSSYDIARGHPMERVEVAGTQGRFIIDDIWRELTFYPANNPVKQVLTNPIFGGYRDFNDTFRARLHSFLQQINDGVSPAEIDGSGKDGLVAQKVIAAAITSIDTGQIVRLK